MYSTPHQLLLPPLPLSLHQEVSSQLHRKLNDGPSWEVKRQLSQLPLQQEYPEFGLLRCSWTRVPGAPVMSLDTSSTAMSCRIDLSWPPAGSGAHLRELPVDGNELVACRELV
eukprot:747091-Hanusia_phi.AAC.2